MSRKAPDLHQSLHFASRLPVHFIYIVELIVPIAVFGLGTDAFILDMWHIVDSIHQARGESV